MRRLKTVTEATPLTEALGLLLQVTEANSPPHRHTQTTMSIEVGQLATVTEATPLTHALGLLLQVRTVLHQSVASPRSGHCSPLCET